MGSRGGGGCIPGELHLLLIEHPVTNAYDIFGMAWGKLVGKGGCPRIYHLVN